MPSEVRESIVETANIRYSKLENRLGWRVVAHLDHESCDLSSVSGWITWFAWNAIRNMKANITIKELYEELVNQQKFYSSITRYDARCSLRLDRLPDRKTRKLPLYCIKIGNLDMDCLAAIFEPSKRMYVKNNAKRLSD